MSIELIVFVNSFFFYLGLQMFKAVYPRYNRPEIFRNEPLFLSVSGLMFFSYAGFIIWSFFRTTWYINTFVLIGSFSVSPMLLEIMPGFLSQSALGLIVPAIVIPLLVLLLYMAGIYHSPQWVVVLLTAVGVCFYFHARRHGNRFGAAMNALMAKYTFQQLDSESKSRVLDMTRTILEHGGRPRQYVADRLKNMNEPERYGFYALAMAELGIHPSLGKERWSYVKNPFVVLTSAERHIRTARNHLKDKYGVEITLHQS